MKSVLFAALLVLGGTAAAQPFFSIQSGVGFEGDTFSLQISFDSGGGTADDLQGQLFYDSTNLTVDTSGCGGATNMILPDIVMNCFDDGFGVISFNGSSPGSFAGQSGPFGSISFTVANPTTPAPPLVLPLDITGEIFFDDGSNPVPGGASMDGTINVLAAPGPGVMDVSPAAVSLVSTVGGPASTGDLTISNQGMPGDNDLSANCALFGVVADTGVTLNVPPFMGMLSVGGPSAIVTASCSGTAPGTATGSYRCDGGQAGLSMSAVSCTVAAGTADLSIAKSASEASVRVGDGFDFVLAVSNAGPATMTAVTVDDNLPSQVSYSDFSAPDFDCSAAGQAVSCDYVGPGLAAGGTSVITLGVRARTPGVAANTATVSADAQAPDPNLSDNSDSQSVAIEARIQGVDVVIDKSAIASIQAGVDFNYLIRVSNRGDQAASGVRVSDVLPAGIVFRGSTGDDWICQESQGAVECDYVPGVLAAGVTSVFRLGVVAGEAGNTLNTASVSLAETDVDPSNNSDTAAVLITPGEDADLRLAKTSLPATVAAGESYEYRLEVSNGGPGGASQVVISDLLPAGVRFVSGAGAGWSCMLAGEQVSCALADFLASGATSTVVLEVVAPAVAGTVVNSASVSAAQSDPNPGDNQSSATTTVMAAVAGADLAIAKSVDRATATQGEVLSYTLTATNGGPDSAAGVSVSDAIPQGLELQEVSAPGWTCTVTTAAIDCDLLQELGVGGSATINLSGRVLAASGNIVNQALIAGATADPNPGNNSATASTEVTGAAPPADLRIGIDDSVDPVLTGDPLDYFVTVGNDGPGQAQGVRVRGALPAGVTVLNVAAGGSFGCQLEGLELLCESPDLILPGAEFLITVSVLAPDAAGIIEFSAAVEISGAGSDANAGNNVASEATEVRVTPSAGQLEQALQSALGDSGDPQVVANLSPTAALCGDPPPALIALCRAIADALAAGREGEVAEVIRQIIGRQTLTQHTSLVEANAVQFRNIDARQAFNRGGGGGGQVSLSGLNFRYGNEVLPLSFLALADEEQEQEPEIDSAGLIKPWGFFLSGTLSGGEKDPTTREIGFDFNTYGLTAGVDYRFSTRFIAGAAIGYADFDSDSPDGSELKTDGFTYHVFASYYPRDRMYLDGRLSYGRIDLDQRRRLRFTIGDLSVDETAVSDTGADQFSGAFGIGLLFNKGGWSFTPRASFSFMDAQIDGFSESGSDFSLNYESQDVKSLIFSAGISGSKVFSLSRGVLTPQFDLSFEHESQNDDNAFNSQILAAAAGSAFLIDADEPDRNYANAGLGLVFVAANGKQAFLSYRKILGLGGFSRWTVNAGLRFEF